MIMEEVVHYKSSVPWY